MKQIILLISIFAISSILLAQPGANGVTTKSKKAEKAYQKAIKALDKRDMETVYMNLEKAIEADPNFIEAYIVMGDSYSLKGNCKKAVIYYLKAIEINPDFFPSIYYLCAIQQMQCGYYIDALINFEKSVSAKTPSSSDLGMIKRFMNRCEYASNLMKNPMNFNPINMGENVNSAWDEYLPTITADEETFIFTVRRPRDANTECVACKHEEDFYISNRNQTKEWEPRRPLGKPINTSFNEGAQSISPDGKYIVFTGCNRDDGMGSCDLYWSKKIGNRWTTPRNMGKPVNTKSWESQPSYAADGKTIYFTSNRPGGIGATDLWKTTMIEDGIFSEPENLGKTINTEMEEVSPFIHPDGKTLYFASNGYKGMGGKDLFLSRLDASGNWSTPENLGYPINSVADEINLIVNSRGNIAFFSSDKDGGFGGLDIYWFELDERIRPTPVTYLKGKVYDELTRNPLESTIELIDLKTGKIVTTLKSDAVTGEFLICLPTDNEYALNVNNEKYLFYSDNFNLTGVHLLTEPFTKDIPLKSMKIGEIVVLKNVFFDTDKFDLKPESKIELNKLVNLLTKNKTIKIEIGGHTDNQGSKEHNQILSKNRANAVYEYLINSGIDKTRLSYQGYGMEIPIATNDTPEGRSLNRRTEFKIVGY